MSNFVVIFSSSCEPASSLWLVANVMDEIDGRNLTTRIYVSKLSLCSHRFPVSGSNLRNSQNIRMDSCGTFCKGEALAYVPLAMLG